MPMSMLPSSSIFIFVSLVPHFAASAADRLLRMQERIDDSAFVPVVSVVASMLSLLLVLVPLLFCEVGGNGSCYGTPDGSESTTTVLVAYEATACSAEKRSTKVAGAGSRARFRVVGTARVAMAAVAPFTVVIGRKIALIAAGWAGIVAWRWRLVWSEGLVGGVRWLRRIAGLGQLTIALEMDVSEYRKGTRLMRQDVREAYSSLTVVAEVHKAHTVVADNSLDRMPSFRDGFPMNNKEQQRIKGQFNKGIGRMKGKL